MNFWIFGSMYIDKVQSTWTNIFWEDVFESWKQVIEMMSPNNFVLKDCGIITFFEYTKHVCLTKLLLVLHVTTCTSIT